LEALQKGAEYLGRKEVESPRLQVEWLLAHLLQMPRLQVWLNHDRQLTEIQVESLRAGIKRRGNREPLQHILGTAAFCGREFKVDRRVLVPRPETELLAEQGWKWLKEHAKSTATQLNALDLGTGSGCLAITLACQCDRLAVVASDLSPDALALARENARALGVGDRVDFRHGEGLSPLTPGEVFDLLITNPPYIPRAEIDQLQPEVRDFDPRLALDGGADGLTIYRLLAAAAAAHLKPGGRLMAEFGDNQGPRLVEIFSQHGWRVEPLVADYSGRARILVACPPGSVE
jgi:release factor glutamine methyltransferase